MPKLETPYNPHQAIQSYEVFRSTYQALFGTHPYPLPCHFNDLLVFSHLNFTSALRTHFSGKAALVFPLAPVIISTSRFFPIVIPSISCAMIPSPVAIRKFWPYPLIVLSQEEDLLQVVRQKLTFTLKHLLLCLRYIDVRRHRRR